MKLLVTTQCQENYGTEENPYWKMKGSLDYFVRNYTRPADDQSTQAASSALTNIAQQCEIDDPMYREWVTNIQVVADDYVTDDEKLQLRLYGQVLHPTPEINNTHTR